MSRGLFVLIACSGWLCLADAWASDRDAASPRAAVDFDTQIIPLLTRAGCNAGACHGAAIGRGDFRLSLYGGNPAADHVAITQELEGRRVNLAAAGESLLYQKPAGVLNHGGGERFDAYGEMAELLLAWIDQGARRKSTRQLETFEVAPRHVVVEAPGATVPLRALARFDDGTQRDVTAWTVWTSSDPMSVTIDDDKALATVQRRGRHVVTARYLDRVLPLEILVPFENRRQKVTTRESLEPPPSYIDAEVQGLLETLRLPISPPADDATFLRRVWLDLTGTLPAPDDVRAFLDDPSPGKRERMVDRLLNSDAFVDFWTFRLAAWLRIRSQGDPRGAQVFHEWVREQVRLNIGLDDVARALLTAEGDTHRHGPANFYRATSGPREQAEYVSEVLLGVRLRCANCHNHPLDRWTQDDYHGLAAVFAKIERGTVVRVGSVGEVTHPATGDPARPRIPGDRFLDSKHDGRDALATWLTDPSNSYFARAMVNRLWRHMLGRGLVEPVDDHRASNPPTHPLLLDRLAEEFIAQGYDTRQMLRRIATSETYARGHQPVPGNEDDREFYSHSLQRPLEPEVLVDALDAVTGVPERYGDLPAGVKAITLFSPEIESPSLDVLGRCSRMDSCETAGTAVSGLSRKLHLLNGELLNAKLKSPQGRLQVLLNSGASDSAILEEFYLRALARLPTKSERAWWGEQFATSDAADRRALWEDVLWSLLSCAEFTTNH